MRIFSTYSAKIKNYNHIFKKTVSVYREAVDFMIQVCLQKWEDIRKEDYLCSPVIYVERLCHRTKRNPEVSYESFDRKFYKLPSYLRRSAISDAIGKVSSYKSNLKTGKKKIQRSVEESLPFQKLGTLIHVCIVEICISRLENMKQGSKSISATPGTG